MKSNFISDTIHETFKYYLPPFKVVARRNEQLIPAIDSHVINLFDVELQLQILFLYLYEGIQ